MIVSDPLFHFIPPSSLVHCALLASVWDSLSFFHSHSLRVVNSHCAIRSVCQRRPRLRRDTRVGEDESDTIVTVHSREQWSWLLYSQESLDAASYIATAKCRVEASELRSRVYMCIPTQGGYLPLQSFPRTSAEVQAYATRFGFTHFLSLWCGDRRVRCCTCCITIAATVIDRCTLLTSSAGKLSSQRESIDLVPSKKAYFRQYPHQEERKSTKRHIRSPLLHRQCKWTAVLSGGTHLWPQKPKKLTKTKKKILLSTTSTK